MPKNPPTSHHLRHFLSTPPFIYVWWLAFVVVAEWALLNFWGLDAIRANVIIVLVLLVAYTLLYAHMRRRRKVTGKIK
jgi:hypothetical protein